MGGSRLPLAADYVEQCRKWYDAQATALEFAKPDAADTINAWIKLNTMNKIAAIVNKGSVAASKAIITNAVYFKGEWRDPFPKEDTQDRPFHLAGGGKKLVPMMRHELPRGAWRSGAQFEAAVLPYKDSGVALYAILPAKGVSPEDVLLKLSLEQLIWGSQPDELNLLFPRFTMDFSVSLAPALKRMGMGVAFEYPGADFRPMGSPEFCLGDVLHKTRLEIDEEGTVAAAATVLFVEAGAAFPLPRKKTLVFDRPFALLLADNATGAVLFAGIVYEP